MKSALFGLVALLIAAFASTAAAQVVQKPKGLAFDCPPTVATAAGGVPDALYVDFYACDPAGNNCGAAPAFSSPNGGLLVTDARLVHIPNTSPATCEVDFTTIPYALGLVYVTKGRWVNSVGSSPSSNPSAPFTTAQGAPQGPANWRLWTPPPSP